MQIGQTFYAAAYAIEWGILILAFFHYADIVESKVKVELDLPFLIEGVYVAFAVLISMGVWHGKLETPYLILAVTSEVIFYGVNHFIGVNKLNVVNPGYSIFVHVFGAFFGAAFSLTAQFSNKSRTGYESSSNYKDEKWQWLGCLFMWVLFPGFNSALAPQGTQLQAVINTVLCEVVTVCSAYLWSHWMYLYFRFAFN
jgi:ammonium transporter Rh